MRSMMFQSERKEEAAAFDTLIQTTVLALFQVSGRAIRLSNPMLLYHIAWRGKGIAFPLNSVSGRTGLEEIRNHPDLCQEATSCGT